MVVVVGGEIDVVGKYACVSQRVAVDAGGVAGPASSHFVQRLFLFLPAGRQQCLGTYGLVACCLLAKRPLPVLEPRAQPRHQ